eukprot:CAMPEP_0194057398 /NCGR_PEP_ID=MMETSP0009_2-20130614/63231_1 /TAXON_ID=210454 /ORGANISM="Grammatophora oceanica, Strain CCMP 410" /LENGTH=32 /DNA_ID= /DNA_START= /DNA_END= /DNA_ORIENTATION=
MTRSKKADEMVVLLEAKLEDDDNASDDIVALC